MPRYVWAKSILMQKHTKIYMNHFGYSLADWLPCENCGGTATSVHHLQFRSQLGGNDPVNLMALCFDCHHKAHNSNREFNEKLKEIHRNKFDSWRNSTGS